MPAALVPTPSKDEEEATADADIEEHPVKLRRALIVAYISAVSLTLIMDFLVSRPIPPIQTVTQYHHLEEFC